MKKSQIESQGNIKNILKNQDENILSELTDAKILNVICLTESNDTTLFKKAHDKVQ